MNRVIFDEPVWWQRPGWQIAAAAVLALVALPIWWEASSPVDREPVAPPTPAPPPAPARSGQAPAPAEPSAAAAAPLPAEASPGTAPSAALLSPPLSTMVAPDVHITPLSVPSGTVPMPAGPRADDSEPEN